MGLLHKEEEAYEALKAALRAIKHARNLCDDVGWDGSEVRISLEESRSHMQHLFDIIRLGA